MLTTTTIQRSAHRSLITSYPRKLTRQQGAFTIVELLLVIVIIAILAAITIVAFNGIQDRARASAVSAALNQASKKLELYSVDNGGYPATLSDAGVTDSNNVSYQYTASTAPSSTYCTTATQGSTSYYISNTTKTPTKGGCPGHGQGGVAAITNLARDPDVAGSVSNFGNSGASPSITTTSIATDRFHHGTTALKKTVTSVGTSGTGATVGSQDLIISAGTTFAWSFWIYSTRAGSITPYTDAAKVSDSSYAGCTGSPSSVSVPANTWTKVAATCTFAQDTKNLYPGGYNLAAQVGDTVWFDEFMVTSGLSYNYADGNSTNWVWNGAANASTSTGPPL